MIKNYLTIDVEDYYQVSAFEHIVGHGKWDNFSSRIENNTKAILDIIESFDVKATFFVLGWIADKYPGVVRDIHSRGNEVGCHSYFHRLIYNMPHEEFRSDTKKTKDILEQITGSAVHGYRAPSYSITNDTLWALDILEELGFTYDSSIFPIYHDRYGIPDSPRFKYKLPNSNLVEYPISTSVLSGIKIPVSGGGYFRLLPYSFTRMALRRVNNKEKQPFVFYLHPWEIDPGQPKMSGINIFSKFRHYHSLDKTAARFKRLLKDFKFTTINNSTSSSA
jgi:polysaccharide deacetylase family protein (PEP-CTERM system associated)